MQQTFSMSESSAKSTNAQFLNSPVTLSSTHRICLHMHKLHWLWVAWGIFTHSDVPAALHKRTKLLLSDLYYDMLLERDIIRLADSRLLYDNVHLAGVIRRTRSCSSAASQRAHGQPGCMVSLWDTRRRLLGHLIFAIPPTPTHSYRFPLSAYVPARFLVFFDSSTLIARPKRFAPLNFTASSALSVESNSRNACDVVLGEIICGMHNNCVWEGMRVKTQ